MLRGYTGREKLHQRKPVAVSMSQVVRLTGALWLYSCRAPRSSRK